MKEPKYRYFISYVYNDVRDGLPVSGHGSCVRQMPKKIEKIIGKEDRLQEFTLQLAKDCGVKELVILHFQML